MELLLLHLIGDYLLQTDWMAVNKTKHTRIGYGACLLHVTLYTLPFLLVTRSVNTIAFIYFTHFFIDKYRLAIWYIQFNNMNWNKEAIFGYPPEKPPWMSFWLMVIIDNTLHLICNYYAVRFL